MKKSLSKSKAKIRIILADDHNLFRAGIRHLLQDENDMQISGEADNGDKAQMLIQQQQPDVALLDIQMSKTSAIEITRWIRSHLPEVGVLILTDYDEPNVMAILQAGAHGYVLKTASREELVQAVRDVNEGKSAIAPYITQKLMPNLFTRSEKPTAVSPLTDRELDILRLASKGYTNKSIGVLLNINDRTVQGYLAIIFVKLQATNRTETVMRAVSLGWIPHTAMVSVQGGTGKPQNK